MSSGRGRKSRPLQLAGSIIAGCLPFATSSGLGLLYCLMRSLLLFVTALKVSCIHFHNIFISDYILDMCSFSWIFLPLHTSASYIIATFIHHHTPSRSIDQLRRARWPRPLFFRVVILYLKLKQSGRLYRKTSLSLTVTRSCSVVVVVLELEA